MIEIDVEWFETYVEDSDDKMGVEFFVEPDSLKELENKLGGNERSKWHPSGGDVDEELAVESSSTWLFISYPKQWKVKNMDEDGILVRVRSRYFPKWYKDKDEYLKDEI